jgi:cytochrome b561
MLRNNANRYGLVAIFIHWLSALTIFGLFILGFWMVDLSYYSEWYRLGPHYHKSIGLILGLLTVIRLVWKFSNPSPKPLSENKIENSLASTAHLVLYLGLILIIVSGYLISTADGRGIDVFNWLTLPSLGELFPNQEDIAGDIHKYAAYALITLAVLHMLAAFKHHYISKDNTLKRMLTIK